MTPLCELAAKYQTDKGGEHGYYNGAPNDGTHGYTPVYHTLLGPMRKDIKRVLEIGVNSGASLRMWRDYFPNAMIYGVDIEPGYLFTEDRIVCFEADAGLSGALRVAISNTGDLPFDLIVDDGSHDFDHQVRTIIELSPHLTENGVLIVEDVATEHVSNLLSYVPAGFHGVRVMSDPGVGKYNLPEPLIVIRRVK